LSATDQTLGGARPHPAESDRQRTPAEITRDAEQRFQHQQKIEPTADWLGASGPGDRPIADLKAKRKGPAAIRDGDRATAVRSLFSEAYFSVQTFMVFMPVSASVLVLNIPLSTTVVVVVVGFLSTTVHFLVVASRTT
jgi:hypothetical protein